MAKDFNHRAEQGRRKRERRAIRGEMSPLTNEGAEREKEELELNRGERETLSLSFSPH
jgi:hypothetical protein